MNGSTKTWWSISPLGYVRNFQFVGNHHKIDSANVHPCVGLGTGIWHPRYLASNTFQAMMSVEKCLPLTPSHISCRIIKISSSCKHQHKIWSYPCLYNFSLMMVKGNAFNTNFFHCSMEYPSIKFQVEMYICISCSHFDWSTNCDALIILSSTPRFLVTSRSHAKITVTKWERHCLYTTKKSYSKNNNSHFAIWPNNWGFLIRYNNVMWSTLKTNFFPSK